MWRIPAEEGADKVPHLDMGLQLAVKQITTRTLDGGAVFVTSWYLARLICGTFLRLGVYLASRLYQF